MKFLCLEGVQLANWLFQHQEMMADLKNLALSGGGGSRYSGDEQVQFIPGGSHQVTIKSPPPSLHLENLNNAVLRYDF